MNLILQQSYVLSKFPQITVQTNSFKGKHLFTESEKKPEKTHLDLRTEFTVKKMAIFLLLL